MGAHGRRGAWACLGVALLLGVVQLAGASHVVYDLENLEVEAATAAVPASIVDPQLRTGYHFQPPKNWINGKKANLPSQTCSLVGRGRHRRCSLTLIASRALSLKAKIRTIPTVQKSS